MPNARMEVTLETLVDSVELGEALVLRIAETVGFDDDDCHKIGMAVREGMINAYSYGNEKQREKRIQLTIELTGEKMVIGVQDEGPGFKLEDVPDPLAEENLLKTSGRGIFLMRSFMDEFDVLRGKTGGALVRMAKKFPASGPANSRPRLAQGKEE